MTESENIKAALRRKGQRLTPQRAAVIEILSKCTGHVTAEDIYERSKKTYPYLNLSTVYRTLELLVENGLVSATDLGGDARQYELLGGDPHHHLICQQCGMVTEIDDRLLGALRSDVDRLYGFSARTDHFAIFGKCAQCRELVEKS